MRNFAVVSNMMDVASNSQWRDLRRFTDRPSKFAHPAFEPGEQNMEMVHKCKVLVVGAGGLGCEILKNLALSGFKRIEVIDMDTIDLSNLNRQFLFREKDVGKSKAEIAAAFIESRVDGCSVVAHNCKIQEKDANFYRSFSIVICGLDSIVARRWLNDMMCSLVHYDGNGDVDTSTIIPLIDGGTEGFKGNARVIYPHFSPCVDCTLDLYPPQVNFPLCTIAHTPRLPEHCVEYVKVILWEKEKPFGDNTLDGDSPEHIEWVFQKAAARAEEYGIRGVDIRLTQGVLKRIIPAVASTNAVIAASCALEALKLASNIACPLTNYLNFSDIEGVNFSVVALEKEPGCLICSRETRSVEIPAGEKLSYLVEKLKTEFQLRNPSVHSSDNILFMLNSLMPQMEPISKSNMAKTFSDLGLSNGDEVVVADESLRQTITLQLKFV
ncbi:hypothetical protein QR680_013318 [Steinernema hermaphroditum]|uniref:NEDD8-activating enzyme E1 catalytic subunit n=1 Tax=Steinernema hermaphroditum TaxID=289476 RepID=A0AA39I7R4_9BILA|nr:hypothetical protein QR680_013318 [Steinernema hermaphroditum]